MDAFKHICAGNRRLGQLVVLKYNKLDTSFCSLCYECETSDLVFDEMKEKIREIYRNQEFPEPAFLLKTAHDEMEWEGYKAWLRHLKDPEKVKTRRWDLITRSDKLDGFKIQTQSSSNYDIIPIVSYIYDDERHIPSRHYGTDATDLNVIRIPSNSLDKYCFGAKEHQLVVVPEQEPLVRLQRPVREVYPVLEPAQLAQVAQVAEHYAGINDENI